MTPLTDEPHRTIVSFEEMDAGPVTVFPGSSNPAIEKVILQRTEEIGGYIGYTIPTEFIKATVYLDKMYFSFKESQPGPVEEAIRLFELLGWQEPEDSDLDALRAEWQAYKDAAEPYTDAVIDNAVYDGEVVFFTRYFLAYTNRPLEMKNDLDEAIGGFSEDEVKNLKGRFCRFVTYISNHER